MTTTAPTRRPSTRSRRAGYAIAAAFNAVFLYLINAWPGWQAVPFLTGDTRQVLWLVNFSLVASLVINLAYVFYNAAWFIALGGLVTTGIGLAVLIRILQVFPFDFSGSSFDWALLIRIMLIVGIVGTCIGIVVQFVALVRAVSSGGR